MLFIYQYKHAEPKMPLTESKVNLLNLIFLDNQVYVSSGSLNLKLFKKSD